MVKRDVLNFILWLFFFKSKYTSEVIKKPRRLRNITKGDISLKMNTLRYSLSRGQMFLHSFLYNIF